jgi:hypothetical protein
LSSAPDLPPRRHPIVAVAAKLAFAMAALMLALFVIGVALGGAWSGEATLTVRAPADVVFDLVESPRLWDEWTPWPEVAFAYEGPPSGTGAKRSWDDPAVGVGSFTVTEARRPSVVRYQVELEGGAPTWGVFAMESVPEGTRVTWREEGDFGRNPLLGWAALSLRRRHGRQLEDRLRGLATVAEERARVGARPSESVRRAPCSSRSGPDWWACAA